MMADAHRIRLSRRIVAVSTFFASLVIFFGLASASNSSQEAAPSEEVLARGREVYVDQCQACHGSEGRGDGPAARFLDPKPRDFKSGEWVHAEDGTVEAIVTVIRGGIDDTGMTPFDELLTEEEITAVANFVLHVLATEQGS